MPEGATLRKILIGIPLLALFLIGGMALTQRVILQNMIWTDANNVFEGCQAFYAGEMPYSPEITARIQARLQIETENQERFSYPPFICLMLWPVWIWPYEIAASLWTFLQLLTFMTLPVLVFRYILATALHPLELLLILVVSLLGYRYTMMTIVLGQYTGFTTLCLVGAIWALQRQNDGLAAVFFAGLSLRNETLLMAMGFAGLALYRRQYRTPLLWVGLVAALWMVTKLFIGNWELPYIHSLTAYPSYNPLLWPPGKLGTAGAALVTLLLTVWAGITLWPIREESPAVFWPWAGMVAIVLGLTLMPQTNPYTLVYAVPGFYILLHAFRQQRWLWGLVLATMVLSWWFFSQGRALSGFDQLFFPLALAVYAFVALQMGKLRAALPQEAPS